MSRSKAGVALKVAGALLLVGVVLSIVTVLIRLVQLAAALVVLGLLAFVAYKLVSYLFGSDDSAEQSWGTSTMDSEYDSGIEDEADGGLRDLLSGSEEPEETEAADSDLDRLQQQYVDGELTDVEFERRMEELMAEEGEESELARERE